MSGFITTDSGSRETHESGMQRDVRGGKGRFDLTSPIVAERLAAIYERGCVKYGQRNWEKGMPLSRFLDSAKRHINDYEMIATYIRAGIPLDRLPAHVNPKEDHLGQAIWNISSMIHLSVTKPELDDLNGQPASPQPSTILPETQNQIDALSDELQRTRLTLTRYATPAQPVALQEGEANAGS